MLSPEEIRRELELRVPPAVRAGLVAAVRDAYRVVASRYHVPEEGHDRITFFVQVWRFTRYRCRRFVREEGGRHGLKYHPARNVFWLDCNGTVLAPYRILDGKKLTDSYPANRLGAGALTELNLRLQLELFGQAGNPRLQGLPAALVLAHQGGPKEGCTGVHLMEPIAEKDGRICKWGYVEPLWVPGQDIGGVPQAVPVGPVPVGPKPLAKPEGSR